MEDGIPAAAAEALRAKGHTVRAADSHVAEVAGAARRRFGKGQVIQDRCTHYSTRYCLLVVRIPSGILRDTLRYTKVTLRSHSTHIFLTLLTRIAGTHPFE